MSATTSGRATDQAIAKIKELISSGEFTAGARLPTERELTQRFGVSRSSLREAVRALALVGVLESRVGDGTYVTTLEPELLLTGIGFVSDLVGGGSLLELHQVRRILEPEATRLATPRLTDEDLSRLEDCLRRMDIEKSAPPFIEAPTTPSTASSSTRAATRRSRRSSTIFRAVRFGRACGRPWLRRARSSRRARATARSTTPYSLAMQTALRPRT
jgi:DNA-binding FadR family transcriptional regulator